VERARPLSMQAEKIYAICRSFIEQGDVGAFEEVVQNTRLPQNLSIRLLDLLLQQKISSGIVSRLLSSAKISADELLAYYLGRKDFNVVLQLLPEVGAKAREQTATLVVQYLCEQRYVERAKSFLETLRVQMPQQTFIQSEQFLFSFAVQDILSRVDVSVLPQAFSEECDKVHAFIQANLPKMVHQFLQRKETQRERFEGKGGLLYQLKVRLYEGEAQVLMSQEIAAGADKIVKGVANLFGKTLPGQIEPVYAYGKILGKKELKEEIEQKRQELSKVRKFCGPSHPRVRKLDAALQRLEKSLQIAYEECLKEAAISQQLPASHFVHMHIVRKVRDPKAVKGVIMEKGYDMRNWIKKLSSPRTEEELQLCFHLTFQMLEAFIYLHESLSLVHQDVKPENMLLKIEEGKINLKIIDFATLRPSNTPAERQGTTQFEPPELLGKGPMTNPAMDNWALGLAIFELFYGSEQNPFVQAQIDMSGMTNAQREDCREILVSQRLGRYPVIDTCIQNLLAFDPQQRWTAKQAYTALQNNLLHFSQ